MMTLLFTKSFLISKAALHLPPCNIFAGSMTFQEKFSLKNNNDDT